MTLIEANETEARSYLTLSIDSARNGKFSNAKKYFDKAVSAMKAVDEKNITKSYGENTDVIIDCISTNIDKMIYKAKEDALCIVFLKRPDIAYKYNGINLLRHYSIMSARKDGGIGSYFSQFIRNSYNFVKVPISEIYASTKKEESGGSK